MRQVSVAASLTRFTAAGVVVTLALASIIALLARKAGMEDATRSAERVAEVVAHGVVEPLLTPELLGGDQAECAHLRAMVASVATGPVTRVKVWDRDGTVLWSDERRLVGGVFPLDDDELRALHDGSITSSVADDSLPENRFERPGTRYLEVHVGVRDGAGNPLLVEIHHGWEAVEVAAQAAWLRFAPASLGALLVLQLLQVPFAWRLARRLRRHQERETRLLQSIVDASEAERRRIAAEVHDGVVQDLTGLTYDLDAARLGGAHGNGQKSGNGNGHGHGALLNRAPAGDVTVDMDGNGDGRELLASAADRLRQSVVELRALLVDLNPPRLPEAGLGPALEVLAEGLRRRGMRVRPDLGDAVGLPVPVATLLYRCALEALRNVSAHSSAQRVDLTVRRVGDAVRLIVDDDGTGFDQVALAAGTVHGHLGLRALGDRLEAAGGSLTVMSAAGEGTRVEATVPVDIGTAPAAGPARRTSEGSRTGVLR
jgi:two-component system, NarL family, sensor kinase